MRKKEKGSLWVRFLAAAEAAGTKLRNCPLLLVNGFEGSVVSSQDVSEMNQPRIHVFSRNDGTQDQFTEKEKTKCQPSS